MMQEIARLGMWNLTQMICHYLLVGLKPSTLLTMGFWDNNRLDQFWAERMVVPVPEELMSVLMPWYADFKKKVELAQAAGEKVHHSAHGLVKLLPYLALVVVSDALELCSDERNPDYRNNPVHALLLNTMTFR